MKINRHVGDLTDEALRAEIELIGELIVAASESPAGWPAPRSTGSSASTYDR